MGLQIRESAAVNVLFFSWMLIAPWPLMYPVAVIQHIPTALRTCTIVPCNGRASQSCAETLSDTQIFQQQRTLQAA